MTRQSLLALTLLLVVGCGGGDELDAQALAKQAEAIQSIAAEGALLARDVADGKSTAPFTRVHARELEANAARLADILASARPKLGVEEKVHQATALARRVAALLRTLEEAPGDTESAREVQRRLESAAKRAEELARA